MCTINQLPLKKYSHSKNDRVTAESYVMFHYKVTFIILYHIKILVYMVTQEEKINML